jgi:hypothetical protein
MWHAEFPIETELEPAVVWDALIGLETGTIAKANGDRHQLDGELAVGETLTSSSDGIPPIQSVIVVLDEGREFAIETNFHGLILSLSNTAQPLGTGGTRLVRRLEITGANADDQAHIAGPRITDDYAEAVAEVIATARSLARL